MNRLLITLAATAALSVAGMQPAVATTSGWRIDDSPISRNERTYADLAPAARSADVWAVGSEILDSDGKAPEYALVAHWNGASWRYVAPPALPTAKTVHLTQVAIAAQVWTIGDAEYAKGVRHDFASYRVGNSWQTHRFGVGFVAAQLAAISRTNIWVLGSQNGHAEGAHYDGRGWNVVALPAVPARTPTHVATPTWAPAVGARLMHWNGSAWVLVSAPAIARPKNATSAYIADVLDAGHGHVTVLAGFRASGGAAVPGIAVYSTTSAAWTGVAVSGLVPGDLTSDGGAGVWVLGRTTTAPDELLHVVGGRVTARVASPFAEGSTLQFDAITRGAHGKTIYAGGFASLGRYVP